MQAKSQSKFEGRGVSMGALAARHDQLTKGGQIELKMKAAPLKAVKQHHTPFNKDPDTSKTKEPMTGVAIVLGGGKSLASEGKWRCKICTFTNEKELTECHKCHNTKQVLKEEA